VEAAALASDQVVTKGAFAALIGVSPGRVSQMIAEGKISPDALEGEGRNARIRVETARAQLRERTDLGQRFGNGITTRLDGALPFAAGAPLAVDDPEGAPRPSSETAEPAPRPPSPPVVASDPLADRLRQIKLEKAERENQQELEEDLARRGIYVRTDQSRAALAGVAAAMLNVFEGSISDLAQALATEFEIPHRDLAHVLRREFRTLRIKAAAAARQRCDELPPLVVDDAAGADPEVASEEG